MSNKQLSERIVELQNADLELREKLVREGRLSDGYDREMEELHLKNAKALKRIIDQIGYPTESKVGKEGSDAAWLVIQHSISDPGFMRECAGLLAETVEAGQGDPLHLAYLTDRIAVHEGKPQRYGTQFDWDEHGQLSPKLMDDIEAVNKRRRSIGLNTMEEQTAMMRRRAKIENDKAPNDLVQRRAEIDVWRKKVGWIN